MIQAAIIIEMINGAPIRYVRDVLTAKTGDDGATPPTQKYAGEPGRYYAYTGNGNDKYSDQTGGNGKIASDLASLETSYADASTDYLLFPEATPSTTLTRYNEDQKLGKRTFVRMKVMKSKISRIFVEEVWTPGINHTDWSKMLPAWSPNFRADGWNEGKLGPYSFPAVTAKTLSKPNIISKTSNTSSITIAWSPDPDYTTFNVYNSDKLIASGVTANTYTFSGLKSGTNYTVGVCGVSDGKVGPINYVEKSTTMTNTSITHTEDGSSINLSWTAVSGASFYRIYIDGTIVENFYKGRTFILKGLTPDTEYVVGIEAVNELSGVSSLVTAEVTTDMVAPSISLGTIEAEAISISWNNLKTGYRYNIYQDDVLVDTTLASATTYTYSGLDSETEYELSITALNEDDIESPVSNVIVTTTIMLIPTISITDITDTSLKIDWTETVTGYTYNIYQLRDGEYILTEEDLEFSDAPYNITDLTPETEYTFGVSSVNGSGIESGIDHETITTLAT